MSSHYMFAIIKIFGYIYSDILNFLRLKSIRQLLRRYPSRPLGGDIMLKSKVSYSVM